MWRQGAGWGQAVYFTFDNCPCQDGLGRETQTELNIG